MELSHTRTERLMPGWMRDNPDDVALAGVVDQAAAEVYAAALLLTTWDKIDELPEGVLDRLAHELDIDWYMGDESIETKRQLIKDSDYVHAHKGTVDAVERVIRACFGGGRIMEWPEYGGKPHHFKAYTTDPTAVAQNHKRFLATLDTVKRYSSKLDAVQIGLRGRLYGYACIGLQIAEKVSVSIHPPVMKARAIQMTGFAVSVAERVVVKMQVPDWLRS